MEYFYKSNKTIPNFQLPESFSDNNLSFVSFINFINFALATRAVMIFSASRAKEEHRIMSHFIRDVNIKYSGYHE